MKLKTFKIDKWLNLALILKQNAYLKSFFLKLKKMCWFLFQSDGYNLTAFNVSITYLK